MFGSTVFEMRTYKDRSLNISDAKQLIHSVCMLEHAHFHRSRISPFVDYQIFTLVAIVVRSDTKEKPASTTYVFSTTSMIRSQLLVTS